MRECARVPDSRRKERREYERALATGVLFSPGDKERASAQIPEEFIAPDTAWELDPEYYAEQDLNTVAECISKAAFESNGNVFLRSRMGARLNLSFTEKWGVCEYQNETTGIYLYAYTSENLREQVPSDVHVVQACPCCGVGMLWYPSRFHMPREVAFGIISTLTSNELPLEVQWLEYGDLSETSCGKG